jgi:uncharacterized membrane protein
MNYLEMELSGRTMMLLGGLSTIVFIALVVWLIFKVSKFYKKKAE